MEKPQLSQLPWTCEHQGSDTDFCIVGPKREDNSSELIAIVIHKLGEIERLGNIKNASSANGNFIIRACNAHDELVETVRGLSANVQVLLDVIKDPNGGTEMAKKMVVLVAESTVSSAAKALVKAEGK